MNKNGLVCFEAADSKSASSLEYRCRSRRTKSLLQATFRAAGTKTMLTRCKMAPLLACALLLVASLRGATAALSATLDYTCPVPKAQGGLGFCGPAACTGAATSKSGCVYTSAAIDYAAAVAKTQCRVCTQSTDARCTAAALSALVVGSSIKAAFCSDTHLVIFTSGAPSWTPNLDDVPNPPGSTNADGSACVTRMSSITSNFLQYKIPLTMPLLSTAAASNNIAAFPAGAADADGGYMGTYGLPTRGSIGVTVGGQDVFPLYNNRAEVTDDACEVDSCNEHVGGGGGQPHLHGDPFGASCLYSAANYTSQAAHPPQIGWSVDGGSIYGRYLYASSDGYSTALDDCGGHEHGSYTYHYHTQAVDTVTTTPANGMAKNIAYTYSTVGVFKCWRGDIAKIAGFWDANNSTYYKPCCGSTQYYVASGISINGASKLPPSPPASSPALSTSPPPQPPSPSSSAPMSSSSPPPSPRPPSPFPPSPSPSPLSSPSGSPSPTSSPSATPSPSSSPNPSPSSSPPPRPPPPPPSPPPSPSTEIFIKQVDVSFVSYDMSTFSSNATRLAQFKADVQKALAVVADLPLSSVAVLGVRAGSVVVSSQISYPGTTYTASQADQAATTLVSAVQSSGSSVFTSSFTNTYGATTTTAVVVVSPTSLGGLPLGAIIGIAVGGGCAMLLLIALLVVLVRRRSSVSAAPESLGVKAAPV